MAQDINIDFLIKNNFSVRPRADDGLWMLLLLPAALIVSSLRHPIILTPTYRLVTTVSLLLLGNSLYIVVKRFKNERLKVLNGWSIALVLVAIVLFNVYLQKEWVFCVLSVLFATLVFFKSYSFLLVDLKESFTLGEAGLVSQGITLVLYGTGCSILSSGSAKSNLQISTVIIQVGLLGVAGLAYVLYKLKVRDPNSFYLTSFFILTATIIIPLHIILQRSPILWIIQQIFEDVLLIKLFLYWSICIAVAVLAISNQIYYAQKASTAARKIFHILAVLVYIPGLYYRCSFLYLASGVTLGLFFAFEILRLLAIAPLGNHLQSGYIVFKDEKDTGLLALTPIYLLVGVSLPIWLHPSPCDVTDSAQFSILPLLGGLLSIGIGDTAASYIGSKFGRLKWKDSSKTVEGTLACMFSQLGFFYFLYYIGVLSFLTSTHIVKIIVAVLIGSLVEAKTTQIDNLVLPLIMYIILI